MHQDNKRLAALLSEQDFPGGAKVEPRLGGSLVGTGLQPNQALAGTQLLLGELAAVLLRWARSEVRSAEFWVAVARSTDGEDGGSDQCDILLVPQVGRLKQVHIGDAIFDACLLELADVIHHFVVTTGGVYLRHDSRRQAVHQTAQEDTVAEAVLVQLVGRELLAEQRFDPVLRFAFLVFVALASDLPQWTSGHSAAVLVVDEENVEAVDEHGLRQGKRLLVFP